MTRKQMVLFLDNDADNFFAHRLGLACALRDAGFEVHAACPAGRSVSLIEAEGIKVHTIPLTRSGLKPWVEIGTVVALVRLYRRLRPDLVHHLRLKPVVYGSLAAWWAGVPAVVNLLTGLGYVFTVDSFKTRLLRTAIKWAGRIAFRHSNQRIVFQNPDDRLVFTECGIVPAEDTLLIRGSGVDVSLFRPRPEPDGPPLVVLASRMLSDKGIAEFVEAARTLKLSGVNATFALVGDTDPNNPSAIPTAQLEEWRDSGAVEWWGQQSDMKGVLARSHVVCLPSFREGAPKVLMEAAACGRPIVTTDAPGCREIVRNGENGFLVPVRNSEALAAALRQLIENADLRCRMGARSREIAVEEFSLERVIGATLDVYHELLAA